MSVTELPSLDDMPPLDGLPTPPETPAAPPDDPAAPYGRKGDGTPKRPPGRPRKGTTAPPRPTVPKPPAPRRPTAARPGKTDYAAAVAGPLSILALGLVAAGQRTGSDALLADAVAVQIHTPAVSQAIGDLAEQQPAVAAVLDKLSQVGPYGALIGALAPLVLQLGVNHRAIPASTVAALEPLGVHQMADLLRQAGYTVTEPETRAA